jgi:hypothetical protein
MVDSKSIYGCGWDYTRGPWAGKAEAPNKTDFLSPSRHTLNLETLLAASDVE